MFGKAVAGLIQYALQFKKGIKHETITTPYY